MVFSKVFTPRIQLLLVAWLIIVCFVIAQMTLVGCYKPEMKWPLSYYAYYISSQMVLGVIFIFGYLIPFYDIIKKIESAILRIVAFFIHGFIFGTLQLFFISLSVELKKNFGITHEFKDRFYNLFFMDLHNSIRTYLILIAILFAYDYFQKNTHAIIARKNMENELDRLKLEALRAQLQPHFLFNSLNTIVALIEENQSKAQQSLIYLSDLLRYTVNLQPHKLVPITEEIETIKTYLYIEKAKYEEHLDIQWEIQPDLADFMVPPLIIQPLVENAIKHGFKNYRGMLRLKIHIEKGKIKIANNGNPLSAHLHKGHGLGLVEKRLQVHFPDDFVFDIRQDGDWVANTILIKHDV